MFASLVNQVPVMTETENAAFMRARYEAENCIQAEDIPVASAIVCEDQTVPKGTRSWAACFLMKDGSMQIFRNKTGETYEWLTFKPFDKWPSYVHNYQIV